MEFIETGCKVVHDGVTYEAGGAMVTPTRFVAYVDMEDQNNQGHKVSDWHGNEIGRARKTGSWRGGFRDISGFQAHMWSFTIRVSDGTFYSVRGNSDSGNLVMGRRKKRQTWG